MPSSAPRDQQRLTEVARRICRFMSIGNSERLTQRLLDEAVALVGGSFGIAYRWHDPRGLLVQVATTAASPMPSRRATTAQGESGRVP